MVSRTDMLRYVDRINGQFSAHAMWDGYYIRLFKQHTLVISGSQDWMYYRLIDIIFKNVTFYNLPDFWRDTLIEGENLFRLTDATELKQHHPELDTGNRHIFAFDLYDSTAGKHEKLTRFVVATNVFFERVENGVGFASIAYQDPLGQVGIHCVENRVIKS